MPEGAGGDAAGTAGDLACGTGGDRPPPARPEAARVSRRGVSGMTSRRTGRRRGAAASLDACDKTSSLSPRLEDIARLALGKLRPKAKSLIVTVYGDAIYAHGGSAWLGSLIRLVEPLGLNERVVRTSVFRLSREGWLTSTRIGRRSYYGITEHARHSIAAVEQRLYPAGSRGWDRQWTLVFTGLMAIDADRRAALNRELGWQGFGALGGGVLLHPGPDLASVRQTLIDAGVSAYPLVIRGAAEPGVAPHALQDFIRDCWRLDRLAADYQEFLDIFRPLWRALETAGDLPPSVCFMLRILLMHGYRRVLLRDPVLPEELLPADWPGTAARVLCRNLYRLIEAPAEQHLAAIAEAAEGPLPQAAAFYFERFGGLRDTG